MASWFEQLYQEKKSDPDYNLIALLEHLSDQIAYAMENKNITKSQLAEKMRLNPPQISRLLSGRRNITLETAVKAAAALGMEIKLELVEKPSETLPQHAEKKLQKKEMRKKRITGSREANPVRAV